MARTPTTNIPLGFKAPTFKLPDVVSNKDIELSDLVTENGLVVMFICNHCPYVLHIQESLVAVGNKYLEFGIGVAAISSNDVIAYPEDHPVKMEQFALNFGFKFPYLYDETQVVAKAYEAACTPDFYFFDKELFLYYRGQFDASRPGNELEVTGIDLTTAIDGYLKGEEAPVNQVPSIGCSIKWKAGNEPDYYL